MGGYYNRCDRRSPSQYFRPRGGARPGLGRGQGLALALSLEGPPGSVAGIGYPKARATPPNSILIVRWVGLRAAAGLGSAARHSRSKAKAAAAVTF